MSGSAGSKSDSDMAAHSHTITLATATILVVKVVEVISTKRRNPIPPVPTIVEVLPAFRVEKKATNTTLLSEVPPHTLPRLCSSLFVFVRLCSSLFVFVRRRTKTGTDEQRRGKVWVEDSMIHKSPLCIQGRHFVTR